ncbi:MAG: hypothetical protein Q8O95_02220 [bacterium]|nr:hypothetical protein [bacterium]
MKTLYVDIDEEIADVLTKLDTLKGAQILFVVPQNATLFQNAINLKLLKQRAEDEKRDIQVFTNDPKGQRMLQKVGIKVYQGHLRKRKVIKPSHLDHLHTDNTVTRHETKKVSITEVSEKTRKNTPQPVLSGPQKKKQKQHQRDWNQFFLLNTMRKKTVIAFSLLALGFFFLVVYVAVPSATVYLTPSSNVIDTTVNITFADPVVHPDLFRSINTHALPSALTELEFEKDLLYKSTGRVFTGSNARCNLKIINERNSAWNLIPKTRLVSPEGIVFRLKEAIEVPSARFVLGKNEKGDPIQEKLQGSLIVNLESEQFDEQEKIIGARGNLPEQTRFVLPGLSDFNQKQLYAINESPCRGGVTEFYSVVTDDDLKASEQKMVDVLQESAHQYLVDYIEGENVRRAKQEEEGVFLSPLLLFDNPEGIQFELLGTTLPPDLSGKKLDEFTVSGRMKVRGISYEQQAYNELMEQGLLSKIHPNKVLSSIDTDSSTFNIVYSDSDLESLSKVKISVSVRGLEEYNFDPRSEQGQVLVNKILDYIPNRSKEEAGYFIANLEEIQKSHISIWPFWKGTLPERRASITIKVQ